MWLCLLLSACKPARVGPPDAGATPADHEPGDVAAKEDAPATTADKPDALSVLSYSARSQVIEWSPPWGGAGPIGTMTLSAGEARLAHTAHALPPDSAGSMGSQLEVTLEWDTLEQQPTAMTLQLDLGWDVDSLRVSPAAAGGPRSSPFDEVLISGTMNNQPAPLVLVVGTPRAQQAEGPLAESAKVKVERLDADSVLITTPLVGAAARDGKTEQPYRATIAPYLRMRPY